MTQTAVIAGIGPGLGAALARKFAGNGYRLGLLARSRDYLQELAAELQQAGAVALAAPADITDPEQVTEAFARVRGQLGPVDVLINHAGSAAWKHFGELSPGDFERSWRICAYGSFLCCKEAVPDMLTRGGAILFTGATSSVRGRAGALAFSSAKFAVRGLAWSLARELWPRGIHVAHIIIDGVLGTPAVKASGQVDAQGPLLDIDAVAETYWNLVQQDRNAWSFEVDVRPYQEDFFS